MVTRSHRIAAARLRARRPKVKRAPLSRRRKALMALAAAVAVWGTVAFVQQYARTYAIAREAAALDQRRETLIAQNEQLREEIQRLKTDNAYIEHLARTELGLVRQGEIEFMIVPEGSSPAGQATAPPPDAAPQGAAPGPDRPAPDAPRGWFDRLILRAASFLASLRR
jgi:cell division protein FtsB